MNCADGDVFGTVVSRRGDEESNLQVGTFRSLALTQLESRAHSGGVGEAGLGRDQPQAGGVQDDDGLGQAGATDQEVN